MTITFDRINHCVAPATKLVEYYSPRDGLAHGSLDATVRTCEAHHFTVVMKADDDGMTPYTCLGVQGGTCGERTLFT